MDIEIRGPGPTGRPMFYMSTLRGIEDQRGRGDYIYYGLVFRIPHSDIVTYLEDGSMDEENDAVCALIETLNATDDCEVGDLIERYEVFEGPDGDVLAMWRIPTRTVGSKSQTKRKRYKRRKRTR